MLNLIKKEHKYNKLIKECFKIGNNLKWYNKFRKENLDYLYILLFE